MLQKSTVQHLRIVFSFFLMPIFWFAISQAEIINWHNSLLLFVILHLLVYPSSNLYNSYMDRDTASIGAIKNPLPVVKEMFYVSVILDIVALILTAFLGFNILCIVFIYILFSRLYSYRSIRLKQYPFIGYITVVVCQGALVYYMVSLATNPSATIDNLYMPMIISSIMIGAFYPLTQVYQHVQDKNDNVLTISILLGIKNTFVFCAILFFLSYLFLVIYFYITSQLLSIVIYSIVLLPLILYFYIWMKKVFNDETKADFNHLMKMNVLSSTLSNIAYMLLIIIK
jgi:1,4-dihydroxy-2-naphthoate octaprenyltransferase